MKQKEKFEKHQIMESKTMGYTRDLWNAVLRADKFYTKDDAITEMESYLKNRIGGKENG